jgi:MtaA/CmuA family methyltransferase
VNSRERCLAHLEGRPVDRLPCMPVTMQFACDLIGAKYRDYASDYRTLAEGQIRVAEQFGADHVSVISDPGVEAADCGAAVVFPDNAPPALEEASALLANKSALLRLKQPDPASGKRMANRIAAVALLRERVGGDRLIEGWIEGPIAEAADLRGINTIMLDLFDDPAFVEELLEFVLQMELSFAKEQVRAGADVIGIGDAAASLIGPKFYEEFVRPVELRMVEGVHALGAKARLHICGNTRRILSGMGTLGCDVVDLDFLAPISEGRAAMGPGQILLGNADPVRVLRNGSPADVTAAVAECHRQAGSRFIVGAGCEVPRDTPHENLRALTDYAKQHVP